MLLADVRRSDKQEAVSGRMNGGRGEYIRESKKDNGVARGARGRDTRRRGLCRDISSCIIHTSSAMLPPPLVEAHSVAGFTRKSKDQARIHTHGDRARVYTGKSQEESELTFLAVPQSAYKS